jgi:hypothetical protein
MEARANDPRRLMRLVTPHAATRPTANPKASRPRCSFTGPCALPRPGPKRASSAQIPEVGVACPQVAGIRAGLLAEGR